MPSASSEVVHRPSHANGATFVPRPSVFCFPLPSPEDDLPSDPVEKTGERSSLCPLLVHRKLAWSRVQEWCTVHETRPDPNDSTFRFDKIVQGKG